MSESIIKNRSFEFAVTVVKQYTVLVREKEFLLANQLLRAGTSIGANVRESLNSSTKKEFVYKLSVSQRECDETLYWLELLKATDLISDTTFNSLHAEATSLLKIIRSIILTSKRNMNHKS